MSALVSATLERLYQDYDDGFHRGTCGLLILHFDVFYAMINTLEVGKPLPDGDYPLSELINKGDEIYLGQVGLHSEMFEVGNVGDFFSLLEHFNIDVEDITVKVTTNITNRIGDIIIW